MHVARFTRPVEKCGSIFQTHREGLSQFTAGVHFAIKDIGNSNATGLAHHPAFQNCSHTIDPLAHHYRCTVIDDHHGIGLDLADCLDEFDLLFGQIQIYPVIPFRFFVGWQGNIQNGHICRLRNGHCLFDQVRAESIIHRIAFSIGKFRIATLGFEFFEWDSHISGVNVRTTTALEVGCLSGPSDDGHLLARFKRQNSVIFEQNKTFSGNFCS
ncbi:hypothetical protein SDC9_116501 [bioreactor metagenome]|uniref:Uncharacterized protein n=1 Tax=bioreactor metagenome TaxID=1076179 RepID=A0A645C6I0_9ZZZZ